MKTVNSLITFLLLFFAIFSVVINVSLSVKGTTSEDDGWTEGDYEGSQEEQEEQAQEDWEDAGKPGDEEDDDDDEDPYAGLPTPEEAGETGVVDCGNGVFVNPREPCPEDEEEPVLILCPDGVTQVEEGDEEDCPDTTSTSASGLPPCDGTFQDCITPNRDICVAGSIAHECELPNPVDQTITPEVPFLRADNGFAPDGDCLFNVDQPKCIPPEGVDCPKGFGTNEDGQCFPLNEDGEWKCPVGTHSVEDDETGQCYPDSQDCPGGTIKGTTGSCVDINRCKANPLASDCPKPNTREFNPPDIPDLDCGDPGVPKNFKVEPSDPHDFDRDGDEIGCENNEYDGSNNNDKTKFIQKTTVFQSGSTTASTTITEVASCKLDGGADGILQKFDTAKYHACGLYVEGQKAYSDGFVAGCTQVGNTQLICQSFVDSNIINTNIQTTQTPTQVATQPTQQGIQPAAVN
ncbi:MAG: hypothetical protein ACRD4W_00200 [Nitrososphaeraceae archaeon]